MSSWPAIRRLIRGFAGCALGLLAATPPAFGNEGALDPSFGNSGVATTDQLESAGPIAVMHDGSVVMAGDFTVRRLTPDGKVDRSFVQEPLPPSLRQPEGTGFRAGDAAVTPDGAIVLSGQTGRDEAGQVQLFLARYLPDGRLDNSFGSGGILMTSAGGRLSVRGDLELDPTGRITLLGEDELLRFMPDGSPDPSFGTLGEQMLGPAGDPGSSLALGTDGKYVVTRVGDEKVTVERRMSDGSLDLSFGTSAPGSTTYFGQIVTTELAVGANGDIYVAGGSCSPCLYALVHLLPSGAIDASFGDPERGSVLIFGFVGALLTHPTGIFVAAEARPDRGFPSTGAIRRYLPDGRIDQSFGTEGSVYAYIRGGGDGNATDVELAADGRLVIGGSIYLSSGRNNFVARILINRGTRDADLDGFRDKRDRCPLLPSSRRRGCPTAASAVSIEFPKAMVLTGKLAARASVGGQQTEVEACQERRKITVMRRDRGPDSTAGSTVTGRSGKWTLKGSLRPGRYYSLSPASFAAPRAYCARAASASIVVPASKSR